MNFYFVRFTSIFHADGWKEVSYWILARLVSESSGWPVDDLS